MKVGDLYPGRVFRETTGLRHMYVLLAVNPIECLMGNWSSYEDGKDKTIQSAIYKVQRARDKAY